MLGSGGSSGPPQRHGVPRARSTSTAAASHPAAPGLATPPPHASSCTACAVTGTASASGRSEGWGAVWSWGLAWPASLVGSVRDSGVAARAVLSPLPGPQSAQAAASGLPAPVLRRLRQPLRRLRSRICPRPPAAGAGGLQTPAHTAATLRCGLGGAGMVLGVPGLRIPLPCGCRGGVSPFPALRGT